jgi:hypothetical protein
MSDVERRRSLRVPVFQEEAAVIHAINRDIPVKIVDLSSSGALFSLDMLAPDARQVAKGQKLELSIQAERFVFQVTARVVRTTQEFVAVEFLADSDAARKLEEKLRSIEASGKAKAASAT